MVDGAFVDRDRAELRFAVGLFGVESDGSVGARRPAVRAAYTASSSLLLSFLTM